jgi:hypothetical protein
LFFLGFCLLLHGQLKTIAHLFISYLKGTYNIQICIKVFDDHNSKTSRLKKSLIIILLQSKVAIFALHDAIPSSKRGFQLSGKSVQLHKETERYYQPESGTNI